MDDYRRQQIAVSAEQELARAKIDSLPIDPRDVARALKVEVAAKPANVTGASGWLVKSPGDQFGILYATHIPNEGFQRFSIGHELGHYCLPGHPEHVFRNGNVHSSKAGFGSADPIEIEADYFAACLMMPRMLFRQAMNQFSDGLDAVRGLQERCRSSLEATGIRYAEITSAPIAVVVSEGRYVRYSALSKPFRAFVGAIPLRPATPLPPASSTFALNSDQQRVFDSDEETGEVDASDWFTNMRGRLAEEAIGLGRYGRTLTVLSFDHDAEDELDDGDEDVPRFR